MSTIFTDLLEVWMEMFSIFWSILPKIFFFILWAAAGVIILPCLFVAGHVYPMWSEWGEDF